MSALAHWCFRRRFAVAASWIVALVALAALALGGGTAFTDAAELPDSESATAYALLAEAGGRTAATETGTIVWHTPGAVDSPAVRSQVDAMLTEIKALPGVQAVISPYDEAGAGQLSASASTAYARVVLAEGTDPEPITAAALKRYSAAFDVEVGGPAFTARPGASHGTRPSASSPP